MNITWNSVTSDSIGCNFTNPVREFLGSHRGSFVNIPGRTSSWYYPEVRGRRVITVEGYFQADPWPEGRRDRFELLADWLDVQGEAELILGDDPDYYYDAILTDGGNVQEWRELGLMHLKWEVAPYAWEHVPGHVAFYGDDEFAEPLWDPGVRVPTSPVFVLTPQDGTMTDIQLNVNLESIYWTGIVNTGQSLTINSVTATVSKEPYNDEMLTGAFDQSSLDMAGVGGVFPVLVPGSNFIDFRKNAGTATDIHVDVYFRKGHRR